MGRSANHGRWIAVIMATFLLAGFGVSKAQSLYKYRDDNGYWVYTDRLPDTSNDVEVRTLSTAPRRATVSVTQEFKGGEVLITAHNELFAPAEIVIIFDSISGVAPPRKNDSVGWVVAARSEQTLLRFPVLDAAVAPDIQYRYFYLPGDPASRHDDAGGYRVPFVAGGNYAVTQAYPDNVTHNTPDSLYAIDIAMPVGTDVLAARDGVVFDVIAKNFRGGIDIGKHAQNANIVRILHDDGTIAVYAHLNWDSIRVRPGERVVAGQYIADSGNTGYSSGPHLHFAVQRNVGMRIEALPVSFRGPSARHVVPATGNLLTAYP